jgi:hypothetical protein
MMAEIFIGFLSAQAVAIILKVCNLFGEIQKYRIGSEKNQFCQKRDYE